MHLRSILLPALLLLGCKPLTSPSSPATASVAPPQDWDQDGVVDEHDGCPYAEEDIDGFEDHDGCPDTDNDGDTVPDEFDKCPNEARTMQPSCQANTGCISDCRPKVPPRTSP